MSCFNSSQKVVVLACYNVIISEIDLIVYNTHILHLSLVAHMCHPASTISDQAPLAWVTLYHFVGYRADLLSRTNCYSGWSTNNSLWLKIIIIYIERSSQFSWVITGTDLGLSVWVKVLNEAIQINDRKLKEKQYVHDIRVGSLDRNHWALYEVLGTETKVELRISPKENCIFTHLIHLKCVWNSWPNY